MKRPSYGEIAVIMALAGATASSLSDAALGEIVRATPKRVEGREIKCAFCGYGGGTLVNYGSKATKIHQRCKKKADLNGLPGAETV